MWDVTMLGCPRYTAIYRGGRNGDTSEVLVNSIEEPEQERIFRAPGAGRVKHRLVSLTKLTPPEGGSMAPRKKGAAAAKNKKAAEAESAEEEELEGLEGLDDELEDLEDEEPEDEDLDEEDEDEEEEKPKAKKGKSKKGKGGKKKGAGPPVRELPAGKVGVERISELSGADGRAVRIFLRKREIEKTDGRYAFTEKQAAKIASALKKSRKE